MYGNAPNRFVPREDDRDTGGVVRWVLRGAAIAASRVDCVWCWRIVGVAQGVARHRLQAVTGYINDAV